MKKGFTLIELMMVITIIALISAITIPRFRGTIDTAKVARVQGDLISLRTSINMYNVKEGNYPDLEKDLSLVVGRNTRFTQVYSKSEMPLTPAFDGHGESQKVVETRDNLGGWLYYKESGNIYANLEDGTYTKDSKNEIWEEEKSSDIQEPPVVNKPNPVYDGVEEFVPGKKYEEGELVSKNGVVYVCTDDRFHTTDPDSAYSFWGWGVVGTVDGSPVELNSDNKNSKEFAIGTVVNYTDTNGTNTPPSGEYMYAPTYGIEGQWNNSYFSNSPEWLPITDDNRDSIVYTDKDTVYYDWNSEYKQGDVVWHKGNLYEANGDVSGNGSTPATTPTDWTKLEN